MQAVSEVTRMQLSAKNAFIRQALSLGSAFTLLSFGNLVTAQSHNSPPNSGNTFPFDDDSQPTSIDPFDHTEYWKEMYHTEEFQKLAKQLGQQIRDSAFLIYRHHNKMPEKNTKQATKKNAAVEKTIRATALELEEAYLGLLPFTYSQIADELRTQIAEVDLSYETMIAQSLRREAEIIADYCYDLHTQRNAEAVNRMLGQSATYIQKQFNLKTPTAFIRQELIDTVNQVIAERKQGMLLQDGNARFDQQSTQEIDHRTQIKRAPALA